MTDVEGFIAARVARELRDGNVVNLGIGLPTMVADFLPQGIDIVLQSGSGIMGMGVVSVGEKADFTVVNAGGQPVGIKPGAMFSDSATSFGIIRGGHVDVAVLGSLEVDEKGNLANWIIPDKKVFGMGGAMDLMVGAKKVIVAMLHTQKGKPKILKQCTLPYTALGVVDLIVTEMGVIEVTPNGLVLTELNPEFTKEQVLEATEAKLIVSLDLKPMQ
jgi:acetate CoA/acetoacetate CoA-transferase beta subunit